MASDQKDSGLQSATGTKNWIDLGDFLDESCWILANQAGQEQRKSVWS